MGRKRIAVVGFVIAIVVGLVVLLVFQASPDERLLAGYLPELESRFGVKLSFQEARASLSGVVVEGVQVRSSKSDQLLCRVERVGVGLRIGPLLMGNVQVTGVRFDGLEIFMGAEAGGASLSEWKQVVARVFGKEDPSRSSAGSASKDVELSVESGSFHFTHMGVALSVSDIGGRLTRRGASVLHAGASELSVSGRRVLAAERAILTRPSPEQGIELEAHGLRAELPADRAQLEELAGVFDQLRGRADGDGSTDSELGAARHRTPSLAFSAKDARFELTRGEEGIVPAVRDIAVRARLDSNGWTLSAVGRLDTSDERKVTLEAGQSQGETLVGSLELSELPLDAVGPLFIDREEISWSRARVSGRVEASFAARQLRFAGQVSLSGLELSSDVLALEPVRDLDFNATFEARRLAEEPVVEIDSLVLERGSARVVCQGKARTDRLAFDVRLQVPRASCRHVLAAVPKELRSRLGDIAVDGQMELDLRLAMDREAPEATVFDPVVDNRCRVVEPGNVPPPDYFRGPFAYTAVDENGDDLRLVTGPGTDRWTPLHRISAFVSEALLTTEDGKFFHHQGVTAPEVRRAIELNLKQDKLAHGASTLTMQLAKNLFLGRERTVARKLQELFFVWYLESNFTKEELLELYLNIVEFGPSIYGITDAAAHYFGREPAELTALESVFLIKLLPSPVERHKTYESGIVDERTVSALHKVLRIMRDRRRLSESEYQEALGETLVFHKEGEPMPEPRPENLRGISDVVGSPVVVLEQDVAEASF